MTNVDLHMTFDGFIKARETFDLGRVFASLIPNVNIKYVVYLLFILVIVNLICTIIVQSSYLGNSSLYHRGRLLDVRTAGSGPPVAYNVVIKNTSKDTEVGGVPMPKRSKHLKNCLHCKLET